MNAPAISLAALSKPETRKRAAFFAVLGISLLWSYWPTVAELIHRWSTEKNYSHGFLVPVFAVYLLWHRRAKMESIKPGLYWGALAFLVVGATLRLAASFVYFDWLEGISLLFYLAGLAFLIGGKAGLGWVGPAVLFLVFMVPLPYRFERAFSLPLQRLATKASTYSLQILGIPAYSEGNIVHLREASMGIVQACNGLGMLVTFVAFSAGLICVIKRPPLDKLLILASAIPIALVANVVRITATGVVYETGNHQLAEQFVHGHLASWLMMALALGFLCLELKLLDKLLVVPKVFRLTPIPPRRAEDATKKSALPPATASANSSPPSVLQGNVTGPA